MDLIIIEPKFLDTVKSWQFYSLHPQRVKARPLGKMTAPDIYLFL